MTSNNTPAPLTGQQLDEIDARAAHLHEYGDPTDTRTAGWQDLAGTDVPALLAEVRRLKAVCGDLADRWDKEATGTQKAIDIDPLGGEVESAQHERVHVYRTTAQDLRALLATGRVPEDLLTTAERVPAAAVAASEACGKCKQPFDPADTSFDGRARYHLTPYCRGCVDRCHDTEIADHRCVICA